MSLTLVSDADAEPAHPRPSLADVAVRLADEGIPVRAIARATRIPSDEVYEYLRDAVATGEILELPKDDWPVGSTRANRSMMQNTILEQEEVLQFTCSRVFKVTRLQAALLSLLLRRNEATKSQLHLTIEQSRPGEHRAETDIKIVDVVICHLRKKLRIHQIDIETVWGSGYLISPPNRERAVKLLLEYQNVKSAEQIMKEAA